MILIIDSYNKSVYHAFPKIIKAIPINFYKY